MFFFKNNKNGKQMLLAIFLIIYAEISNFYFFIGEIVCRPCYDKKYSCRAHTMSGADMLKLLDTSIIKGQEEGDKVRRATMLFPELYLDFLQISN